MDNFWFYKFTITQKEYNINVHQLLVVTFVYTGVARGLITNVFVARMVKKVGQHWSTVIASQRHCYIVQPKVMLLPVG